MANGAWRGTARRGKKGEVKMAQQQKDISPLVRREMFYRKAAEMGSLSLSVGKCWLIIPVFLLGLVLLVGYIAWQGVEFLLKPSFRVLKWWKAPYDLR